LSEERFCELCNGQVWFGAYGTTEDHVDFTPNPCYESRKKVCKSCIDILNELPVIKKEKQ